VMYVPGVQGAFVSQPYSGLLYGVATPAFSGTPVGNSGYTFTGWSPSVASTVTGDVTYVAQWTSAGSGGGGSGSGGGSSGGGGVFVVRFVDWDGVLLKSQRVRSGGDAVAPVNPSRDGYVFAGWDRGFVNVRSDVTVTAQYAVVEPEVPPTVPPSEAETWAFANLVLSVVGIILVVIVMVWVLLLRQRQKKNKTMKGPQKDSGNQGVAGQNDAQKMRQWQCQTVWLFTALVLSVVGLVVFLLTENMSLQMGLVDRLTIVNAILFVAELVAIAFAFKHKKLYTN